MPSPVWQITVDFGSGFTDITKHCDRLDRERNAHHDLRPTVNTASFIVTDLATSNLFNAGGNDLPVVITKDGVAWFVGQVRPTYDTIMTSHMEELRVQCVDDSIDLQKTIDDTFAWTSYKVCDTGNKSTSIVHQLLVKAGFALGDMSLTDIDVTLTRYSVERSEERVFWDELSDLLFEYGFVLDVGYDGVFVMHDMHPTSLSPAAMIDADTAHFRRQRRERPRWEAARITWHPVQTFTDVLVFSDRTNGDDQSAMNVALANGEYYPPGAGSDTIYSIYEVPDAEILDVTSEVLIWDKSGVVTLETENFGIKKAEIVFLGGVGGGVLTRFDIRGTATVRDLTKINKEVVYRVANTDRILEYVSRFIQAVSDAQQLASDLSNFYNFAKFVYEFEIVTDALSADVMSEFTLTSVAQNSTIGIRIMSIREDEWGNRFATAEGITAYSLISSEVQNVNPSAHVPAARDDQVLMTKSFGTRPRTPQTGDVEIYGGMDPDGNQVAGVDLVEFAIKEFNGETYETRFRAGMRAGGGVADGFVSGFYQAGEAVLSSLGRIWHEGTNAFSSTFVEVMAYGNDVVVAGALSSEIARSTDGGKIFGADIANNHTLAIHALAFGNNTFIAAGQDGELSRSTNDGVAWSALIANAFATASDFIFDIAYDPVAQIWVAVGEAATAVLLSDDDGVTWTAPTGKPAEDLFAVEFVGNNTFVALAQDSGTSYTSFDSGDNWEAGVTVRGSGGGRGLAFGNNVLVASILDGGSWFLYRSEDQGATWAAITWATGDSAYNVQFAKNMFFAHDSVSTDGGRTFGSTGYSGGTTQLPITIQSAVYAVAQDLLVIGGSSGLTYYSEWLEAGAGIVEQGSNSNGEYVRFSSGRQVTRNISAINANPKTLTHPAAFLPGSVPVIVGTVEEAGGRIFILYSVGATTFDVRVFDFNGNVETSRTAHWHGEGRWK